MPRTCTGRPFARVQTKSGITRLVDVIDLRKRKAPFEAQSLMATARDGVDVRVLVPATNDIAWRGHPCADELLVRPGSPWRHHPDDALDGDVLLRLCGCQLSLPNGERGLPDGDKGYGYSALLRNSHGFGGHHGPHHLRPAHRH